MVLTDSGGVVEEAASCNIPVLVLRETTERNEAVIAGCAIMAGTTTYSIVKTFNSVYDDSHGYLKMKSAISPFGNGDSSKKILTILEQESIIQWLSDYHRSSSPKNLEIS